MTEERKHAILFAATLLCARKIIDLVDSTDQQKMGKRHWLGVFEKEAIEHVAALMGKIDERWQTDVSQNLPRPRFQR
jgi:hypothetical protein